MADSVALDTTFLIHLQRERRRARQTVRRIGIKVSADLLDKIQEQFERIESIQQELRGLGNGVSVDVEPAPA